MIGKIKSLLGLQNIMEPQVIRKGLSKLNPNLGRFFTGVDKAGLGIGAALAFLNSQITGAEVVPEEGETPFETSGRELKRQRDIPRNVAKSAAEIGVGALTGGVAGKLVGGLGSNLVKGASLASVGGLLGGSQQQQSPQDFTQQVDIPPQQAQQIQDPTQQAQQEQPQEVSMLDTLRGIDGVLATEVEAMLGENMSAHEMEKSLKTSRAFLQRTLNAERKIKMPMSRILEIIQGGGVQTSQGRNTYLDAIKTLFKEVE